MYKLECLCTDPQHNQYIPIVEEKEKHLGSLVPEMSRIPLSSLSLRTKEQGSVVSTWALGLVWPFGEGASLVLGLWVLTCPHQLSVCSPPFSGPR